MTDAEVIGHLRERLGKLSVDEAPDRQLREYLASSMEWLAGELDYSIRTHPNAIGLVAGEYMYPLPADCLLILWIEWCEQRLTPASLFGWVRDGKDWRHLTSANPAEYALEGRQLILAPPPSSTAITSDPFLDLSYIAGAPDLNGAGVRGLSDTDMWCVIYSAACEYLGVRPSEENSLRYAFCERQVMKLLPQAKKRHMDPVQQQHQKIKVYSARDGGAR